jgi:predicted nuclease of predicted toxin-antitoxin system
MKIKLDENLPEALVNVLGGLGHDVDNVRMEGIAGRDDSAVWTAAQAEGRFLITQDLDFSDVRQFSPGTHHGILLVRLPNAGRIELTLRIRDVFLSPDATAWEHCFVVLSEHKLRVIRP